MVLVWVHIELASGPDTESVRCRGTVVKATFALNSTEWIYGGANLLERSDSACREHYHAALGLTEQRLYPLKSAPAADVQHRLLPLLRPSVYSRLAGFEDARSLIGGVNDPAMRVSRVARSVISGQRSDRRLWEARFETFTVEENLEQGNCAPDMLSYSTLKNGLTQADQRVILVSGTSESRRCRSGSKRQSPECHRSLR